MRAPTRRSSASSPATPTFAPPACTRRSARRGSSRRSPSATVSAAALPARPPARHDERRAATSGARCAAVCKPGAADGWEPEELVAGWTLLEEDRRLVANKTGATRLGFALLLKLFDLNARFAVCADELPAAAVDYVARQVGVDAAELARYAWSGRTIEYHRAQIRRALGFREAGRADEARLTAWLADDVAAAEPSDERLRQALLHDLPA
jgi:hypothetical protein